MVVAVFTLISVPISAHEYAPLLHSPYWRSICKNKKCTRTTKAWLHQTTKTAHLCCGCPMNKTAWLYIQQTFLVAYPAGSSPIPPPPLATTQLIREQQQYTSYATVCMCYLLPNEKGGGPRAGDETFSVTPDRIGTPQLNNNLDEKKKKNAQNNRGSLHFFFFLISYGWLTYPAGCCRYPPWRPHRVLPPPGAEGAP